MRLLFDESLVFVQPSTWIVDLGILVYVLEAVSHWWAANDDSTLWNSIATDFKRAFCCSHQDN